jgi:hypothetical protein
MCGLSADIGPVFPASLARKCRLSVIERRPVGSCFHIPFPFLLRKIPPSLLPSFIHELLCRNGSDARGPVLTARHNPLRVFTENRSKHATLVATKNHSRLSAARGVEIPESRAPIAAR